MSTYKQSLFPDYYYFENGRSEVQAAHIVERLRSIGLEVLVTDDASSSAERRSVVARLRQRGVKTVMQMIALSEEDVRQMGGMGAVFLDALRRMQQEALQRPEVLIERWEAELRAYVLPDDLDKDVGESFDFFGKIWADFPDTVEEPGHGAANPEKMASSPDEDIVLLEKCIVESLKILEKRWNLAAALKSFFVEGMPVAAILSQYAIPSNAAWRYLLQHRFVQPLLCGEVVCGVRLSESLLQRIPLIAGALCYGPASALDALTVIPAQRFLEFFGFSLLRRTTDDGFWHEDYVVRTGEVQRCRHTLRYLMQILQTRVAGCREKTLRKLMHDLSKQYGGGKLSDSRIVHHDFLRHILGSRRWIEEESRGYRLPATLLAAESVRIARIVYDAKAPIATSDIVKRYENLYMESPKALNLTKIRQRFPRIKSVSRGIWRYK